MPGSRYIVWDTAQLEAVLQKDPALRNALLAHLAAATAKKLFEVSRYLGRVEARVVSRYLEARVVSRYLGI